MFNNRNKIISFLLILFLFVSMVGAINVDTSYAATKKIHLKKTTISLVAGKTYQQKLIDKNGKTIKATKVKWKSSKTSVAKISKKGKITAVKAGTAKMTAKYKGKTYSFKVKVKTKYQANLEKIYKYVKDKGYSVDSNYYVPGNRCIEYTSGSEVFIISIKSSDPSKIYFASFKTIPDPGNYDDTTETTLLTYDISNTAKGKVEFLQVYYSGKDVTSWGHFTSTGVIKYANYTADSYYNENGITDITIGSDRTPVSVGSYDSKYLIDGVRQMTTGVDKLLSRILNLRLRDIGFKKL